MGTNYSNEKISVNIPLSEKPRVVVVGGGFGGLNVVKHLNPELFQVVLLDRYNYHTFQPLLYQVATAGLEPDSVAGPLRKIIKKNKNIYFRMLKAESFDTRSCILNTNIGSLKYDYLILCTGSQVNYFNKKDIAGNAFPLKQITHALDLRSHIFQQYERIELLSDENAKKKRLNYVVIGAGPTGVEICGALAELKKHVLPRDYPEIDFRHMQIYLIEGLGRVLPAMSEISGRKANEYLDREGVHVILNCLIESYDGNIVKLNNGMQIESETVIWAAGVKADLIGGFSKGSIEKGYLLVNEYNQVYRDINTKETYRNIFALGDISRLKDDSYPEGYPGLAPVAMQQGINAARNLNRMMVSKPAKPFRYRNKGVLATIGRNRAVADFPGNIRLSGFIGWFIWLSVHIMYLVGFRNKAVVFSNWVWNYITYDRGMRLIIRPSPKEKDEMSNAMIEEMKEKEPVNN